MLGSIGGPELIVIFLVALLIFGPRKLPELGRAIGRGLAEFRKTASDLRATLETEVSRDEGKASRDAAAPGPTSPGSETSGAIDAGDRSKPS